MSRPIDRRTFLAGALAVGAAACSGDSDGDPTTPGSGAASSTAPTSSTGPATTSTVLPATPPPTTIATVADPQKVPGVGDGLFRLGVASGDPLPGGVVLWTRLAPEPLDGGGMPNVDVPLRWQVADDERFRSIVASGIVTTRPRRSAQRARRRRRATAEARVLLPLHDRR
ncbi:MAG: PhoD-like phosphatase N-terminal domain-containing protein [Ilumatobacteraceae bacterium]